VKIEELAPFLTIRELAEVLRVSRNTAYSWARQHPRTLRVGAQLRIPRAVVLELLGEDGHRPIEEPDGHPR
jgi:excisionase family DNA binding protein